MLQFDEFKLKIAALQPGLVDLGQALNVAETRKELEKLEAETTADGFWDDLKNSRKVLQRTKQLQQKCETYDKLYAGWQDLGALCEMAIEESDESLLPELSAEFNRVERTIEELRLSTLLAGEYDSQSAILSFHAGAGGTEAQDWAQMLYRMYNRWAERHGYIVSLLDYQDGEEAGLKSATISIEGLNAYGYLKSESGIHRLVRISPFDASGRRHTSFAAIEVMPDLDDSIEIDIRSEDLRVDTFRSSGAGGQHINKTDSAVRITHLPTGIVVECQDDRSQHKNRAQAMSVLAARIRDVQMREQQAKEAATRKSLIGSGDRSERIRTYNYPQGRVTDHRINLTLYKLDSIMDGDLDELTNALATEYKAELLAEMGESV